MDHFAVDLSGHRLFLTAEVHKTVEVFNLNTGERIHSITGFGTPHEILFRPDSNTLVVADGGSDSSVRLLDGKTYQIIDGSSYRPVSTAPSTIRSPGSTMWRIVARMPPVVASIVLVECLQGYAGRDALTNRFLKMCDIVEEIPQQLARRVALI